MDGDHRRTEVMKLLLESEKPLSGIEIAKTLGVSRQVIVQDIALLRASNNDIISTNKGYRLFWEKELIKRKKRIFGVSHSKEKILDELLTIVDLGGSVLDVVIEHTVYGQIMVDLVIQSRADAEQFAHKVNTNQIKPLNELTNGVHYHTVEADSADILNQIEEKLEQKGYLLR